MERKNPIKDLGLCGIHTVKIDTSRQIRIPSRVLTPITRSLGSEFYAVAKPQRDGNYAYLVVTLTKYVTNNTPRQDPIEACTSDILTLKPQWLRTIACETDAAIVGCGSHFEIWNLDLIKTHIAELDQQALSYGT